jgi:group I intron endonuclease
MSINKALLKYDYSGFQLEILEYCEPSDVILREQHYIDLLAPEYNILKIAGSSLGFKHSDVAKAKISLAKSGEKHHFAPPPGEGAPSGDTPPGGGWYKTY